MLKTIKLVLAALFIAVLTAAPVMANSSNSISKRLTTVCGEPIGSEYSYIDGKAATSGSAYRPVCLKILPQNGMGKGSAISIYIENGAFIPDIYPMPQYESGSGKSFDQMMQDYESGLSLNSVLAANLGVNTTELPYKIVNAEIDKIDIELFPVLESECDKSSNSIAVDKVYYYIPINAIATGVGDVKITIYDNDTNVSGGGTYTIATSPEPINYREYAVEEGNLYCTNTGFIYKADSYITEANIPEAIDGINVIGISSGAFKNCSYLKQLTIPSGVLSIDASDFVECRSLKSVNVDSDNKAYASSDGVLFNKNFTKLIYYPNKDSSSYTVPKGVVALSDGAFTGCSHLKSVTLPSSVASIGKAFEGCSSLTSVFIPTGVASIDSYAFKDCSSLTGINIPSSVTSVGYKAFEGCSSLTSVFIPTSAASIDSYAFKDCSSLTSVNMPIGVISIGKYAFQGCTGLTSVSIPKSVTSLNSYTFDGCVGLTSVNIPDGTASINDYAFSGCTGLTKAVIPNSVEYIGKAAFAKCGKIYIYCSDNSYAYTYSLESRIPYVLMGACGESLQYSLSNKALSISGAGEMDNCAQNEAPWNKSASDINKIDIGDGVTSIGSYAFYGCEHLQEVSIPKSVISIGEHAFDGCSTIESIAIPETVETISETAFSNINSSAVIYNYSNVDIDTSATVVNRSFLLGDTDCDGIITAGDAAAIHQKVLNLSFELRLESFTDNLIYYCSVDGDNTITSNDAAYVLQKSLNSAFEFKLQGE